MSKAKIKKQDTFIDMTAMSDVTVLLLCFFMLTSTFVANEPIQVQTPASVSEIMIPEQDLVSILFDANGKIFMSFTNDQDKIDALTAVGEEYGIQFTPQQQNAFKRLKIFGVPIQFMGAFLDFSTDQQEKFLTDLENQRVGIPNDAMNDARGTVISVDNEFIRWINSATTKNPNLRIALKADKTTKYPVIKKVIDDLRSIKQNKYIMITSLRTTSNE